MNYQSVYTVSPTTSASGTWSLDGQLIPNPLSFGSATYIDSFGTNRVEFVNSQIAGSTHPDRLAAFLNSFTRWRLAYAGVTIYQDGPDLANQGTVVVCQKPVSPVMINPVPTNPDGALAQQLGLNHAFHLNSSDLPNYNSSQGMPNAYFGKSRDGAYIPLKLTRTHQKWHGRDDLIYQATGAVVSDYSNGTIGGQARIPASPTEKILGLYPFMSVNDLHMWNTGGTPLFSGTLTSAFCNDNWADFSFKNLSVQTSLSFFFRFGFECQLQPGSQLAPHLKLSPEHDEIALDSYFKVARELKDAYPADYNDLGKIWDIISSIAKTVAPALSAVPVIGPALSTGVGMGASLGDRIKEAVQRSKKPTLGSTMSQSDVELLRALPPPARVAAPVPQRRALRIERRK